VKRKSFGFDQHPCGRPGEIHGAKQPLALDHPILTNWLREAGFLEELQRLTFESALGLRIGLTAFEQSSQPADAAPGSARSPSV
jgi:hypothetical protein